MSSYIFLLLVDAAKWPSPDQQIDSFNNETFPCNTLKGGTLHSSTVPLSDRV